MTRFARSNQVVDPSRCKALIVAHESIVFQWADTPSSSVQMSIGNQETGSVLLLLGAEVLM